MEEKGFSIVEVLLCFILLSSSALLVTKQHLALNKLINSVITSNQALLILDNFSEQKLAKISVNLSDSKFELREQVIANQTILEVYWKDFCTIQECVLSRALKGI